MERTGIQVENEKSRPILTAKNICVLVYVLTPNNETGGSGEEPPVSSILESNSAKLRAKNSVLQSKMNNLCQISRQIFRRSFSRNSARYKTFMFLCQVPRLCQIDRLPCFWIMATISRMGMPLWRFVVLGSVSPCPSCTGRREEARWYLTSRMWSRMVMSCLWPSSVPKKERHKKISGNALSSTAKRKMFWTSFLTS